MSKAREAFRVFAADDGGLWQEALYLSFDCPEELRVERARERIWGDFVDPFVGMGVEALVCRVDHGNQFLCYDTRAGDPLTSTLGRFAPEYGLVPRSTGGPAYISKPHLLGLWRLAENFRRFAACGFDPWEAIIDRAHKVELKVFLSLDLNRGDHEPFFTRGASLLASPFLLEHPEYLLGYECQCARAHASPEKAFCSRLDFTRAVVRAQRLAVVEELCGRYDLDGVEIDLDPEPHLFRKGEVERGRDLMNDFMRAAREIANRAGRQRGRPIELLVRFHTGTDPRQAGLDIDRWLEDRWVDLLVPVVSTTINEHVGRIEACVAQAVGRGQVLAGFSSPLADRFSRIRPSPEMLRAANLSYRRAGVGGFHMWWPRSNPRSGDLQKPVDYTLLKDLGPEAAVARGDKHYILSDQLPLRLEQGDHAVHLRIADDLAAARSEGRLAEVRLVLGLWHFGPEDEVVFRFNGREIPLACFIQPAFPSLWYRVGRVEARLTDGDFARQGDNELAISVKRHVPDPEGMTLEPGDPRRPDHLVLTHVELIIKYRPKG